MTKRSRSAGEWTDVDEAIVKKLSELHQGDLIGGHMPSVRDIAREVFDCSDKSPAAYRKRHKRIGLALRRFEQLHPGTVRRESGPAGMRYALTDGGLAVAHSMTSAYA